MENEKSRKNNIETELVFFVLTLVIVFVIMSWATHLHHRYSKNFPNSL